MLYYWALIGFSLIIMELITGSFYLLMLALAIIPAWIAEFLGATFLQQSLVYLFFSSLLLFFLYKKRKLLADKYVPNSLDFLDEGTVIQVSNWKDGVGSAYYRGALWQVVSNDTTMDLQDGAYRISKIDGIRLVVRAI